MTQRRRSLLFLALVLGLVAASIAAISLKPTVLGLDLKGGSRLLLQAKPTEDVPKIGTAELDRAIDVINRRVNAFGVAEPDIQREGTDQISIALAGVTDARQLDNLVKPAVMSFFDLEVTDVTATQLPNVDTKDQYAVIKAASALAKPATAGPREQPTWWMFGAGARHRFLAGPADTSADLDSLYTGNTANTTPLEKLKVERLRVPAGYLIAATNPPTSTSYDKKSPTTYSLFLNTPSVPGSDFTGARVVVSGGETDVQLDFNSDGDKKFKELTALLYRRGETRGVTQHFAAILDGEIISAPQIDYKDRQVPREGIDNGGVIRGNFTISSAQTLAKQLNAGAIPIKLVTLSREKVSASLGAKALRKALVAGFIGLGLVMLFMVAYYRVLGLIADLALLVYGVLFYAVIELVPITMTLPGIAGMVLTIGVAADANVVIFERIREEARAGRTPRTAILNGYKKGISAIVDANVVTLITAAIIFLLATSGPKGFAFTLFIGVILSLFTAVLATRAVFEFMADSPLFANGKVMGLDQREIRWKFDFVGKWRLWLAISFLPLLAGTILIGTKGIKQGLDFTGGTKVTATFKGAVPSEQRVRDLLAEQGVTNPKVQRTTNSDTGLEGYSIEYKVVDQAKQTGLETALERAPLSAELDTRVVGPTFGAQIVRRAIFAILLSFAVIILYLTLRFEMKLALPALASVIHDVWLAISIYSLTGREVTSATVAALLTILGYSLYDVVIVFDRIRENVPLMRNHSYREIVNRSVHETLTRSIITSLLTTAPVAILYFFGGETLKDFSFALLVGILSGGVSSILISAPLAALWKERDPAGKKLEAKARKRRLRESAVDSDIVDVVALARAEAALAADPAVTSLDEPVGLGGTASRADDPADQAADGGGVGDGGRPVVPPAPTPPAPPAAPSATAAPPEGSDDGAPAKERRHRQVQRKRRK